MSGDGDHEDPRTGRRPALLVVEDEPNARAALVALLLDEGYAVTAAVDGEDALRCLDVVHPDLVLTDVMMPRLGGIGLLDRVAARAPRVPVIVMTAWPERLRGDAQAKVAAILPKPIDFDRLLAAIRDALARHPARG
ncbi:MAG: response regulator [Nannocystaceae bacterium]